MIWTFAHAASTLPGWWAALQLAAGAAGAGFLAWLRWWAR